MQTSLRTERSLLQDAAVFAGLRIVAPLWAVLLWVPAPASLALDGEIPHAAPLPLGAPPVAVAALPLGAPPVAVAPLPLGAPPVAVAPLPRDARISGPPSETRILATLFQTHTQDATFLSDTWPDDAAVSELLIDHVLAETHPIAPELFGMIRTLALEFPGSRFEIVSGFRSEKRNEAMRKKGHHVASHSQHSLGTAVDFRLIPACGSTTAACPPIDPIVLEKRLRKLGWKGGIGVYLPATERFVHMDVGKNRRWKG